MSSLAQAKFTIDTGGQLQFIKQFNETVNTDGLTVDLTKIQFENVVGVTRYLKIVNFGSQAVFVAFDDNSNHFNIDPYNRNTWNLCIDPGRPFNDISMNGETSKISLRCGPDAETNITLIVW